MITPPFEELGDMSGIKSTRPPQPNPGTITQKM